jgi:uncharacterized protein YceK
VKRLLCLLLVSCSTPQLIVEHPLAKVTASSKHDASFVSWVVHTHGPGIAAMLGVDPEPVEVEVFDTLYLPHDCSRMYGAFLTDGTIALGQAALHDHGHKVAHELVHAYASDEPWNDNLSPTLREGVAEFVSLFVTGELDAHRRLLESWPQDSDYARGFQAVDRVGLRAVVELARLGPVTEAALFELPTAQSHECLLPR